MTTTTLEAFLAAHAQLAASPVGIRLAQQWEWSHYDYDSEDWDISEISERELRLITSQVENLWSLEAVFD